MILSGEQFVRAKSATGAGFDVTAKSAGVSDSLVGTIVRSASIGATQKSLDDFRPAVGLFPLQDSGHVVLVSFRRALDPSASSYYIARHYRLISNVDFEHLKNDFGYLRAAVLKDCQQELAEGALDPWRIESSRSRMDKATLLQRVARRHFPDFVSRCVSILLAGKNLAILEWSANLEEKLDFVESIVTLLPIPYRREISFATEVLDPKTCTARLKMLSTAMQVDQRHIRVRWQGPLPEWIDPAPKLDGYSREIGNALSSGKLEALLEAVEAVVEPPAPAYDERTIANLRGQLKGNLLSLAAVRQHMTVEQVVRSFRESSDSWKAQQHRDTFVYLVDQMVLGKLSIEDNLDILQRSLDVDTLHRLDAILCSSVSTCTSDQARRWREILASLNSATKDIPIYQRMLDSLAYADVRRMTTEEGALEALQLARVRIESGACTTDAAVQLVEASIDGDWESGDALQIFLTVFRIGRAHGILEQLLNIHSLGRMSSAIPQTYFFCQALLARKATVSTLSFHRVYKETNNKLFLLTLLEWTISVELVQRQSLLRESLLASLHSLVEAQVLAAEFPQVQNAIKHLVRSAPEGQFNRSDLMAIGRLAIEIAEVDMFREIVVVLLKQDRASEVVTMMCELLERFSADLREGSSTDPDLVNQRIETVILALNPSVLLATANQVTQSTKIDPIVMTPIWKTMIAHRKHDMEHLSAGLRTVANTVFKMKGSATQKRIASDLVQVLQDHLATANRLVREIKDRTEV